MSLLGNLRRLDQLIKDEITCPVCKKEFQNPKCLPCFHSVCESCLQELIRGNNTEVIHCPIDRGRFFLPEKGVNSLPNNVLLLRMLETQSGVEQDKTHSKFTLQKCREKVQKIRQAVENKINAALEKEKQRVKKQIHNYAEKLRRLITEKENEMYSRVDHMVAEEMEDCLGTATDDEVLDQTESLFQDVEKMIKKLQTHETKIRTRRSKSFVDFLLELDENHVMSVVNRKPCSSFVPFVFEFAANETIFEALKEQNLGTVTSHTGRLDALNQSTLLHTNLRNAQSLITDHVTGKVLKTLEIPKEIKDNFKPSGIAVSRLGQIGIMDAASDRLCVFDESYDYFSFLNLEKRNEEESTRDTEQPQTLAFSHDSNILLINNCKYNKEPLRVFDCNGKNMKCPVHANDVCSQFTSLSVDNSGRLITSFNHPASNKPFIQVYASSGLPQFTIPVPLCDDDTTKERTHSYVRVEKVLYCHGKFIVSYSDFVRNRCCAQILDRNGNCIKNLKEEKLMENDRLYPLKIAVDQVMATVLCYHGITGKVSVYDLTGQQISTFSIAPGVTDIALSIDHHLVAICNQSGPVKVSLYAFR